MRTEKKFSLVERTWSSDQKEFWRGLGVDYVEFSMRSDGYRNDFVFLGRGGWSISPAMKSFEVYWHEQQGERVSDCLVLGLWGMKKIMRWDQSKKMFLTTNVEFGNLDRDLCKIAGKWVIETGATRYILNPQTGQRSNQYHDIWMEEDGLYGELGARTEKIKLPWDDSRKTGRELVLLENERGWGGGYKPPEFISRFKYEFDRGGFGGDALQVYRASGQNWSKVNI